MAKRPIINKDETHTAAKPVNTDGDDRTEFDADAVALLPESGIIEGYSDGTSHGTYGPDDSLTREQMGKITDLAYDLDDADSGSSFPDSDEITSWIEDDTFSAPAAAVKVDIASLRKDEDGEQSDDAYMNRGDLAKDLVEEAGLESDHEQATPFSDTSGHDYTVSGPAAEAALGGPSKDALNNALSGGTGDDRSDLVADLPYTDPNETTLDDTLGQALDASSKQGEATASKGADVKTELGGEQLAGLTEVDEAEDLNPNDVIES